MKTKSPYQTFYTFYFQKVDLKISFSFELSYFEFNTYLKHQIYSYFFTETIHTRAHVLNKNLSMFTRYIYNSIVTLY